MRIDTGTPPVASVSQRTPDALSTDCRVISRLLPTERLLFAGDTTCAGTFACRPDHPLFGVEAPSTSHCIAFSRTPVWIRHEDGARYVADPTVATFHNRGRVYRRWQIAAAGDRCDWVAFADDLVMDALARRANCVKRRNPTWFPTEFAHISSRVYARQRRLFDRLAAGAIDACGAEEEAVGLLGEVLSAAEPSGTRWESCRQDADAVQHVRALLAATPSAAWTLSLLAQHAEMTPFQLCRAFSRVCGETMTAYRLRLRLLSSLERVRAGEPLTDVALSLGFSSHSHFSAAFRVAFGVTPTSWRRRG